MEAIVSAVLVAILFSFFTAVLSGAGVAFYQIQAANLRKLKENFPTVHRRLEIMIGNPQRFFFTLLVYRWLFSLAGIIPVLFVLRQTIGFIEPLWLLLLAEVAVVFIFIFIFTEYFPKLYAAKSAYFFARFFTGFVYFLYWLALPLSRIAARSQAFVVPRIAGGHKNISMDEISEAIEMASKDIDEEKALLKGVVKFGNIGVTDIMQPRVDVVAVEIRMAFKDLIDLIVETGYSRIPVFDGNFDNIRGVLYVKDLMPHIHKPVYNWQNLLRPPYFVPETKKISSLLKEFQRQKIHMAIVVDEYGGTSGIITLEDILEEIVGEIADESDDVEIHFSRLEPNKYLFEGKTQLNDFCKIVEVEESLFEDVKGDAETLAGLLLEINGEFPRKNQVISYRNFEFTILQVDKRRIKQIQILVLDGDSQTNFTV